jgi:hypothetical protein
MGVINADNQVHSRSEIDCGFGSRRRIERRRGREICSWICLVVVLRSKVGKAGHCQTYLRYFGKSGPKSQSAFPGSKSSDERRIGNARNGHLSFWLIFFVLAA